MHRMNELERTAWTYGSKRDLKLIKRLNAAILDGAYQCDECEAPAVVVSHDDNGAHATLHCEPCYKASARRRFGRVRT